MADWKDILSNKEQPLSDEELLKYLDETTSKQDKTAIKEIAEDPFEKDALEGLSQINNTDKVTKTVTQLKHSLHQQLKTRSSKKRSSKIDITQWSIIALLLLLLICILGYVAIKMFGS